MRDGEVVLRVDRQPVRAGEAARELEKQRHLAGAAVFGKLNCLAKRNIGTRVSGRRHDDADGQGNYNHPDDV